VNKKRKYCLSLILTFLILLIPLKGSQNQTLPPSVHLHWSEPYQGPRYWETPPNNPTLIQDGDQIAALIPGPQDPVHLIIQLTEPSIADALHSNAASLSSTRGHDIIENQSRLITEEQKRFIISLQDRNLPIQVNQQNAFLINSLSITMAMDTLQTITQDPSVNNIWPDYVLQAELDDSVPLIGAPTIWEMTSPTGVPVTGLGSLIAIIDTGIDYRHPDLGGCFGAGCKVFSGYDFVNDDSDPIDDHGHGTHVAGIAAANGQMMGVAPDATLLAYKVLDDQGSGPTSDVISAMEQAVLAGANVINLSLGGPGTTQDALSQAITNAMRLGTLVVASAGNFGPNYTTIRSPGLAPDALTVGATTKSDILASFSSRGPVGAIETVLKPDLVAPGVGITAPVPQVGELGSATGYTSLSGTSMAAPHAAGAAALLKQYNPNWSAENIKNILMLLSQNLGLNPFVQGNGRLDLQNLGDFNLLIEPASLDFGLDDLTQDTWTKTKTITVKNLSIQTRNIHLSLSETFPTGITCEIFPSSLTLDGLSSAEVTVTLIVDNLTLPNVETPPFSYSNNLLIDDGADPKTIPLAFVKMPALNITSPDELWVVAVHNQNDHFTTQNFSNNPTFFLPADTYDVIILFLDGKTRIVKENLTVESYLQILVDADEAVHRVDLNPKDINNQAVSLDDSLYDYTMPTALYHKDSGYGIITLGRLCLDEENCDHVMTSDFSDHYQFEISIPLQSPATNNDHYRFFYTIENGISDNINFTNQASDLTYLQQTYDVGSSDNTIRTLRWFGTRFVLMSSNSWAKVLSRPFEESTYTMPIPLEAYLAPETVSVYTPSSSIALGSFPGSYQTPIIYPLNTTAFSLFDYFGTLTPLMTLAGPAMPIGIGPFHWAGTLQTEDLTLTTGAMINASSLFANQLLDFKGNSTSTYQLQNLSQQIIAAGSIYPGLQIELPEAGEYRLEVMNTSYQIGTRQGLATARLSFNTTLTDSSPPNIITLTLEQDQAFRAIMDEELPIDVTIKLDDENPIVQTTLAYRLDGDWVIVEHTFVDQVIHAALDPLSPHQTLDLKLIAVDSFGNRLEFTAEPAALCMGDYQLMQIGRASCRERV
jgi:hypothetical protein